MDENANYLQAKQRASMLRKIHWALLISAGLSILICVLVLGVGFETLALLWLFPIVIVGTIYHFTQRVEAMTCPACEKPLAGPWRNPDPFHEDFRCLQCGHDPKVMP